MSIDTNLFFLSLAENNFSETKQLAKKFKDLNLHLDDVRPILPSTAALMERVRRGKYWKGEYRWGHHPQHNVLIEWTSTFVELLGHYDQLARPFDHESVFYWCYDDQLGLPASTRNQNPYRRLLRTFRAKIDSHGPLVRKLDIKSFYPRITGESVLNALGHRGLGIAPKLVDRLSGYPDIIDGSTDSGLPVGPTHSHILARFILTPMDRRLLQAGVEYLRFADDIFLFGRSVEELDCSSAVVRSELEHLGLELNPSKQITEFSTRAFWHSQGVFWGSFPIEDYVDRESWTVSDLDFELGVSSPEDGKSSGLNWQAENFDLLRLYNDHSSPIAKGSSESGHRWILREMAWSYPDVLTADCNKLLQARPINCRTLANVLGSNTPLPMSIVKEMHSHIQHSNCRSDDLRSLIDEVDGACQERIAGQALRSSLSQFSLSKSAKIKLISALEPNEYSVELALDAIGGSPWLEEHLALGTLIEKANCSYGRGIRDTFLMQNPTLEAMYLT